MKIKSFIVGFFLLIVSTTQAFSHDDHPRILSARQAEMGELVAFPEVVEYVNQVGKKLASVSDFPDLPYEFFVLNSSVPNAWAFPGGKIGITRGFLLQVKNEAELASVLAHEMGHQTAFERERLKRMEKFGFTKHLSKTSHTLSNLFYKTTMRAAEFEADFYGVQYLAKAGYDTQAAIELQKHFLMKEEHLQESVFEHLFETHPSPQARIEANLKTAAGLVAGIYKGEEEFAKIMSPLKETEVAYKTFDEGEKAYRKGDLETAYRKADEALTLFSKEPLFYGLIGKTKEEIGDYEGALAYFDQALRLNKDYFEFHLHRGLALKKLGYKEVAQEELETSLYYFPTPLADFHLGELAIENNAFEKATFHFLRASSSKTFIGSKARTTLTQLDHILSYLE